jgi:hypothetical protein
MEKTRVKPMGSKLLDRNDGFADRVHVHGYPKRPEDTGFLSPKFINSPKSRAASSGTGRLVEIQVIVSAIE